MFYRKQPDRATDAIPISNITLINEFCISYQNSLAFSIAEQLFLENFIIMLIASNEFVKQRKNLKGLEKIHS